MQNTPSSLSSSAGPEGDHAAQFLPGPAEEVQIRKWRRGDVGPDGRVFWRYASRTRALEWVAADLFKVRQKDASLKVAAYIRRRCAEDPVYRARLIAGNVVRNRARLASNPAARKHRRSTVFKWQQKPEVKERRRCMDRKRMRENARHAAAVRLRTRLRDLLRRGFEISRKGDGSHEGAAFLSWSLKRAGLVMGPSLHVEHLWPLSRWQEAPAGFRPNGPENVRWLGAKENWQKQASLPSLSEVAAHLALVEEWKKETGSQKTE